MSSLEMPYDILTQIFLHLPIKQILRCKCVCKSWHTLITGPDFINLHRTKSTATPSSHSLIIWKSSLHLTKHLIPGDQATTTAVATPDFLPSLDRRSYRMTSCNGLLCFYGGRDLRSIILCNPSTLTYQTLPSPTPSSPRVSTLNLGFGYDQLNDDYKVVRVVKFHNPSKSLKVWVSSLKTPSWRQIEADLPRKYFIPRTHKNTCVSGNLHFLVHNKEIVPSKKFILGLNLGNEQFHEVSTPLILDNDHLFEELGVVGGRLYLATMKFNRYDLWIMKEYGVKESWTKICAMEITPEVKYVITPIDIIMSHSRTGKLSKVLFEGKGLLLPSYITPFFWYKLSSRRSRGVRFDGVPGASRKVPSSCTCIETLVPLRMPVPKSRFGGKRKNIKEVMDVPRKIARCETGGFCNKKKL